MSNKTELTVLKYATCEYKMKIQLFSDNKSHYCLPNVEVWEDVERGVKSFSRGFRFENIGIDKVTLENTDMAILFYWPKLTGYRVKGNRRTSGAIGKGDNFTLSIRAENSEQAEEIVRQSSYINDFEHVHIVKIEEV